MWIGTMLAIPNEVLPHATAVYEAHSNIKKVTYRVLCVIMDSIKHSSVWYWSTPLCLCYWDNFFHQMVYTMTLFASGLALHYVHACMFDYRWRIPHILCETASSGNMPHFGPTLRISRSVPAMASKRANNRSKMLYVWYWRLSNILLQTESLDMTLPQWKTSITVWCTKICTWWGFTTQQMDNVRTFL